MDPKPILLWLRRDFRLADNPALTAAAEGGRPVIPVIIRDDIFDTLGAAPKWRLGLAIKAFDASLRGMGSRVILRTGPARDVLLDLVRETGADTVLWGRQYDPYSIKRDKGAKAALKDAGIRAESFPGHLLFEPWTVETGQGGPYRVYSPYWRAVQHRDVLPPLPAPKGLTAPGDWPASENLSDWNLGGAMNRGAAIVGNHVKVGADAAQDRLTVFLEDRIAEYKTGRDFPARSATSGLSENLTYGEISPRQIWHAVDRSGADPAAAKKFLQELVWREFAWHLGYHYPTIDRDNWRDGWGAFPWRDDPRDPGLIAWQRGQTGIDFVDAAMRELFVTGTMHNRARMIVASYLTKHLMVHWRQGLAWFADTLVDWDWASNAMGWQWVAGCGPDAAPFFRIFNPDTQAQKFDPDGAYRRRWLADFTDQPGKEAMAFFDAAPRRWSLDPAQDRPAPLCDLPTGRAHALDAYQAMKGD